MKVLLAEDSSFIRQVAVQTLRQMQVEVVEAKDGLEAVHLAYQHWPQGLILDLTMPQLGGAQVARLLREEPYFQKVPIVALTAKDQQIHRYWAQVSGIDKYFLKPEGLSEFQKIFRQIVDFFQKKVTSSLSPPTSPKNLWAYLQKKLVRHITSQDIQKQLGQDLNSLSSFPELHQKVMHFLQKILGPHLFYLLLAQAPEFSLSFGIPFEEEKFPKRQALRQIQKLYAELAFHELKDLPVYVYSYPSKNSEKISLEEFRYRQAVLLCKSPGEVCPLEDSLLSKGENHPKELENYCGMLGIWSLEPLLEEIQEVLLHIGEQISQCFFRLLLQKKLDSMAPLKAYVQLLSTLNSTTNLPDLLEKGLKEISQFSQSQAGILYLWSDQEEKLSPAAHFGVSQALLRQSFQVGEGLVGLVAKERTHLCLDSAPSSLLEIDTGLGRIQARGILLLPICFQKNLLGVLALGSLKPYEKEKIPHILAMADQFAIALHNATTMKKVEESQHKGEFLATMSHELRTCVHAILGYTSLALSQLREKLSFDQLQNLMRAEQAARNLLQIVNNFLDYSKIEAGKMEVYWEEVSLEEILTECRILVEGLLQKKPEVKFQMQLPKKLPKLKTDYTKFLQILTNLLSNSVKFTEKGSVTLRVKKTTTGLWIEVEDTGVGIEPQKLANIFEAFEGGSSPSQFSSTGLGLAITKKLCELLELQIQVQSQPGKGSCFSVFVPKKLCLDLKQPESSSKASSRCLLVVDDNPEQQFLIQKVLEGAGYQILTAATEEEALEIAKNQTPGGIILDLAVSQMRGFHLVQKLKSTPATSSIPIAICSAYSEPCYKAKAEQLGCVGYITKPVESEILVQQIYKFFGPPRPQPESGGQNHGKDTPH